MTSASPLYYVEGGTGEPVVFLHGMGCDHRVWGSIRPHLANGGWRVVTPDLPGHGQSPKPWRSYGLNLYMDYLARWLNALNLGPVHLIGHSLGGALAVALALERPDLVRSVGAICAPRLVNFRPAPAVVRRFMQFGLAQLFGRPSHRATSRFLEKGCGVPGAAISSTMVELWQQSAMQSTRASLSTYRSLQRPEFALHRRVQEVRCPVWMLYGKRDPLFPGVDPVACVAERLPQASLEFTDTGHLPMLERTEEFQKRVEAHLHRVRA